MNWPKVRMFVLAGAFGVGAALLPKACAVAWWVNEQYDLAHGQALKQQADALKAELDKLKAAK